jgi:hypothetical protein
MGNPERRYDRAQALFDLAACTSEQVDELISAAHLDAKAGDVAHIDLSELDLRGQESERMGHPARHPSRR